MSVSRRVLMIVGGVGLGNSTRCHAVIDELRASGVQVDVASSGRGLEYFARQKTGVDKLIALPTVTYGNGAGSLNLWRLPLLALRLLGAGARSFVKLRKALRATNYAAVIVDSNYNLAPRLLFRGPLISINNSDRIFAHRGQLSGAPLGTWLHFLAVEQIDYAYQRLIPDLVLSPWPVREVRPLGFEGIGLIVRTCPDQPREAGQILVMGSGSGLGRIDLQGLSDFKLSTYGLGAMPMSYDTLPALKRADAIVINAGFSSLSEGLVNRKRILALPLGNHAEQHIVCGFLKSYGWIQTLNGRALPEALDDILRQPNPLTGAALALNGASQAALGILRAAGLESLNSLSVPREKGQGISMPALDV